MALVTTPRAGSTTSNTPSKTITRHEVSIARPTTSSARAEALKARLTQSPQAQPIARRPVGSSARAEELGKLNKFSTPTTPAQVQPVKPATSARALPKDLTAIEPPPSGLAPGQDLIQPNTSAEALQPPAEATSDEQVDPQFASLARQTRQLRKAQQEFKAAQDAWKQDQAKYLSKEALTADPLKALAEVGITPDKLVELQINQAAPPTPKDPQQVLLDKIAELETKLHGITDPEKGVLAKRDQEAYDQAVSQIQSDVDLLVESNPAYGLIKSEAQTSEVVKLITSVFDEEGVVLDVEEACQLVEEQITKNLTSQYERLSKYEKIQSKLRKPAENPEEASPAQQSQKPQQPKTTTLTNAGATTRPLSARDRAVLAVQERLNAKGK